MSGDDCVTHRKNDRRTDKNFFLSNMIFTIQPKKGWDSSKNDSNSKFNNSKIPCYVL